MGSYCWSQSGLLSGSAMPSANSTFNCNDCPHLAKSIFKGIDSASLDDLASKKTVKEVGKGKAIFLEGHPPAGVYCVREGKVKLVRSTLEGGEQIVELASEGGMLSGCNTMAGLPNEVGAYALNDATVCLVENKEFEALSKRAPIVLTNLARAACRSTQLKHDMLYSFSKRSVRQRVADALLFLVDHFSVKNDKGQKIDISLSRAELATLAGTVLESVVRHLSEFSRAGHILIHGKEIVVKDVEALKEIRNN